MKNIFLLGAFLISALSMSAQETNVSISGALPTGDAADFTSFGLNIDANYLWQVSEQFDLGVTAGYHHYFGEDVDLGGLMVEVDDFGFLPVAAAARLNLNESITFGADVGYAIGVSPDGNDGGFYYAPKIQYGLTSTLDIVLAYKGISRDGGSFDSLSLGVEFGL
ncbi:outer membrane beta-barrel protein [Psychroflexus sediminis]|uniref:Outer membrane protein beta-barrel domain-containing protein n=1 Tax=Psychroflexus sediminis TaxID=470826 RepID=A0A1G7VMV7_9FLAO|nr:outer membrane beta-barrel protein [Psychroflexus sediminis]SDG61152.1 hypothetical protein SAMN04488027_10417 [Psychroflexus sediminis]